MDKYAELKLYLKEKIISKEEYNKRITKLNNRELKLRANKIKDEAKKQVEDYYASRVSFFKKRRSNETKFGQDFYEEQRTFNPPVVIDNVSVGGETISLSQNAEVVYSDIISNINFSRKSSILVSVLLQQGDMAEGKKGFNFNNDTYNNGAPQKWVSLGKAIENPSASDIKENFGFTLVSLAEKTIDSGGNIIILGYSVKYIPIKTTTGGCDSFQHNTRIGDLKTLSPKSSKNNCLFACIHHALELKGNFLSLQTRKALGFDKEAMIDINDIEKVAQHYKITIHLHDMEGELTHKYNEGNKIVNIMLYISNENKGHYVLITNELKFCDKCRHSYFKDGHKCNVRRQMWVNRHNGLKNVIPSKVFKEAPFNKHQNMFYYDIETFKPEDTDAITPYAVGWSVYGKYQQEYGVDAWKKFIRVIINQKDKVVCAYNGAGFDFHFLMTELLDLGVEIKNVIMNNGRLMSFGFGDGNRCWDLCCFTLSSLDSACEAFKVSDDNKKTSFDHFKIKSWEDVELYRNEVEPYMMRDVLGMKEVFEKFDAMLYEIFKVYMTDFVTLSSLSYALWTSTVKEVIEIPETEKYNFIRQSLYGGRTYPMVREFTSKHYSEIIEHHDDKEKLKDIYNNMSDWIFNGDVTSLYPTAMVKHEYPIGMSKWVEEPTEIKIGIYDVEIECNQDLIVPVIPRKTPKGGIIWDLIERRGIYTSVDINNALKYGYTIKKIHRGLEWEKTGNIFEEYIMKAYKIKEENDDNPVKRQIGKILMNALYGKMLEKARFEECKMCSNLKDVYGFMKEYDITDLTFIKDKVLLNGIPKNVVISDDKIKKPSHIGTFILSQSRTIMLDTMSAINPKLDDHFFTYTDTDSLHIHASKLPLWKDAGMLEKGLGKVSDDAKGGRIFREINLAPKLYMYLCLMPDGKIKTTMKSKGIPQQYLSPHLFENADTLCDDEKLVKMEHRLKKVGYGKHLQTEWRKYDVFSVLSVDMERTFYKNMWLGMRYEDGKFYPNKMT